MKKEGEDGQGAEQAADPEQGRPALPEVNEATVVGRLANTPRLKSFGEGKERAQFSVAVPRPKRGEKGKPPHDYVSVVGWGALARQVADLAKDDGVRVQGRIRTWQDTKNKRFHCEIAADAVEVLDRQETPKEGFSEKAASRQEAAAGV